MILAWRIPALSEQTKAATRAAMGEVRGERPGGNSRRHEALAYELIRRLEAMGYRVTLEPLAA